MLERAWFYTAMRDDLARLASDLRESLRNGDYESARRKMEASPSAEAAVVVAGLVEMDKGSAAAQEAMLGALALQRQRLEQRLAFLGTLGNNAPFIGLFGTVIGVVQAFAALGRQDSATASAEAAAGMAPQEVMSSIAEALVATAVGLAVAIHAVATYNFFVRRSKQILGNTEALSRVLLAHLAAVDAGHGPAKKQSRSEAESS